MDDKSSVGDITRNGTDFLSNVRDILRDDLKVIMKVFMPSVLKFEVKVAI